MEPSIDELKSELLGAVIGLARGIKNHKMNCTPLTYRLTLSMLLMAADDTYDDAQAMRDGIDALRGEHMRVIGKCAHCEHPCGKYSEPDMAAVWDDADDIVALRQQLLADAIALAQRIPLDSIGVRSNVKGDQVHKCLTALRGVGDNLNAAMLNEVIAQVEG